MSERLLRIDLHTHTRYSTDGWTTPAQLVARAVAAGLDRIAVTDHGTLEGAHEAHAVDSERVIVGEEIRCQGFVDLIGLFLEEHVPDGMSVEASAAAIRDQGGVVYGPHPFAYPFGTNQRAAQVLAVADVVEVLNGRAFVPSWNRRARLAAERSSIPGGAGSDAHFPWEIGRCYAETPAFDGPEAFLAAIPQARMVRERRTSPLVHVASLSLELLRGGGGLFGRRRSSGGALVGHRSRSTEVR